MCGTIKGTKGEAMTKYAEWVTLPCGKCRWLRDIGTITDTDMDPACDIHQEFKCLECGAKADGATTRHGTLGGSIHQPVRKVTA